MSKYEGTTRYDAIDASDTAVAGLHHLIAPMTRKGRHRVKMVTVCDHIVSRKGWQEPDRGVERRQEGGDCCLEMGSLW
jgi:hypothetical protein